MKRDKRELAEFRRFGRLFLRYGRMLRDNDPRRTEEYLRQWREVIEGKLDYQAWHIVFHFCKEDKKS